MYTGGYSASCAAMSYPDIGAVVILAQPTPCVHNVLFLSLQILDATFDEAISTGEGESVSLSWYVQQSVHVAMLVVSFVANFSRGMVQEWMNLNIAEQICHYPGPITVIRREQDEMMSE